MVSSLLDVLIHFIYPLNAALLLSLTGVVLRWRRWKRAGATLVALGLLVLLVFSMPATSGVLVKSLERQYLPSPMEEVPTADAIVVLGGGVDAAYPPREHPQLNSAANRDFYGAMLFKAGKAPWVIVSGHSDVGTSVLEHMGVPAEHILLDDRSSNTRENALYALEIMEAQGDIQRVLLVTSALHMPRALATFEKAGIDAVPTPTDYQALDAPEDRPLHRRLLAFLPHAGALDTSTRAIHEYLGIAYYRLRGWI